MVFPGVAQSDGVRIETEKNMRAGKVSQTVYRRSVQKQLHTVREEFLLKPSAEEMCTAMRTGQGAAAFTASCTVSGMSPSLGICAVAKAVNDLAARGGVPAGVSVQILLPVTTEETALKTLVHQMEMLCQELKIQIAGIQAEVNPAVSQMILVVNALGSAEEESLMRVSEVGPGQDIVLCGYIGLEGMLRILDEREEELVKRFVPAFISQMRELRDQVIQLEAIEAAKAYGVTAMQQVGSGGIFAALWEMAEAAGVGLEVDLAKMSIRQETVEVCEYYHLNPYQMTSAGCILMMTENGEALVKALEEGGARASRLGVTTAENARVVTSGKEQRFLERPAADELMGWQMKHCE